MAILGPNISDASGCFELGAAPNKAMPRSAFAVGATVLLEVPIQGGDVEGGNRVHSKAFYGLIKSEIQAYLGPRSPS